MREQVSLKECGVVYSISVRLTLDLRLRMAMPFSALHGADCSSELGHSRVGPSLPCLPHGGQNVQEPSVYVREGLASLRDPEAQEHDG